MFDREIDQAASFQLPDQALEHDSKLFDTAVGCTARASGGVVGQWVTE